MTGLITKLPADLVEAVLGIKLQTADVWISQSAEGHIYEKHMADFTIIRANLSLAISEPDYVGWTAKNQHNITFARALNMADPSVQFVAVSLSLNKFGNYNVATSFLITRENLNGRVRTGKLRSVPKTK
jgi:hypothetical protein